MNMSDQPQNDSANTPDDILNEHEDPVIVRVRDGGVITAYEVREFADPNDLGRWTAKITTRVKNNDWLGMQEDLIAMCLYGPDGNRVPKSRINTFGTRLKARLFDKCQQLNGLTDEAVKRAGNSFGTTGAGSSGGGTESPAS